jgi:hypothetical protein
VTVVRPPVWPPVTPPASGGAGNARTAAQRAFFEAALGKTAAPQGRPTPAPAVRAETVPQPAAQRVRTEFVQPTEQPQKILRPGSLLDIKV